MSIPQKGYRRMVKPPSSPRRVLFTHPSAELYGSDRMALETVRALIEDGKDVWVVVPADGPLVEEFITAGAHVRVFASPVIRKAALRPLGFLRLLFSVLATAPRILRLTLRLRPQVVYVNTIVQPWWLLAARISRCKVVAHVREAETGAPRLVRACLLLPLLTADVVIANSKATASQLKKDLPRVAGKTAVIYNGKDWSGFEQIERPQRDAAFRVLFIGRLNPRKGPDLAIEAVAELVAAGRDATLDIAGNVFPGYEWYEEQLRGRVDALDLTHRVRFHGFVADPRPLMGRSDVLVVPSRVEPFGTVAAEGMAAHLPVVVAAVQGLTEIVKHGETGLVVGSDDASALASALTALAEDERLRDELASAGAADVRARFSRDRYDREIKVTINGLLGVDAQEAAL